MSYILNSQTLPTPNSFRREFISISNDVGAINGKTGRDMRTRKEKFVLSWKSLTSSQLSIILDIVNGNVPVNFSVNDSGLIVEQTSVIVNIGSIRYLTPGSTYLAETEIELVEVE